jgi:hypothetical protein
MRRRGVPLALVALVGLVIVLFAGVTASSAEVASTACPPPATDLPSVVPTSAPAPAGTTEPAREQTPVAPEQTLVCVGPAAITGATYSHWLAIAKKSQAPAKGHAAPSTTELQDEVLGFLISSDWVKGEAQYLGISVSPAKVNKTYERIRHQQFPKRGEFKAFLRLSGQTVADLHLRVELNLLSARIQKRVTAGHHGASGERHALSKFVKAFKAKWEAQTYCAAQYDDAADCGHVQESV